MSVPGAG